MELRFADRFPATLLITSRYSSSSSRERFHVRPWSPARTICRARNIGSRRLEYLEYKPSHQASSISSTMRTVGSWGFVCIIASRTKPGRALLSGLGTEVVRGSLSLMIQAFVRLSSRQLANGVSPRVFLLFHIPMAHLAVVGLRCLQVMAHSGLKEDLPRELWGPQGACLSLIVPLNACQGLVDTDFRRAKAQVHRSSNRTH